MEVAREKYQMRPEMGSSFVRAQETGCQRSGALGRPGDLKPQGDWEWQTTLYFLEPGKGKMKILSKHLPRGSFIMSRGLKFPIPFIISIALP